MATLPGGLTSLLHLNAFSADIADALHTDGISPPWTGLQCATYASARARTADRAVARAPPSRAPPLLPDRDAPARRAARQAAARRLRDARARARARLHDPAASPYARPVARSVSCSLSHSHSPPSSTDGDVCSSLSLTHSSEAGEGALVGQLKKRGRKTRLPVRRVFVLTDAVLYNYRSVASDRPTWKLSMPGAVVGLDVKTLRIVVALDGDRTLVLYAPSVEDARVWTDALARAADSGFGGCRCNESVVRGGDVADLATEVPGNENWDSFRSFAKLQIRTSGVRP